LLEKNPWDKICYHRKRVEVDAGTLVGGAEEVKEEKRFLYCLYCYEPLKKGEKICPVCGCANLATDRKKYWTREGKLVLIENILKGIVLVGCLSLCAVIALFVPHYGTGSGYLMASPIMLAIALWWTVSALTRRDLFFRASWFWLAFIWLVGGFLLLSTVEFYPNFPEEGKPYFIGLIAGMITATFLILKLRKVFNLWKERKITQKRYD